MVRFFFQKQTRKYPGSIVTWAFLRFILASAQNMWACKPIYFFALFIFWLPNQPAKRHARTSLTWKWNRNGEKAGNCVSRRNTVANLNLAWNGFLLLDPCSSNQATTKKNRQNESQHANPLMNDLSREYDRVKPRSHHLSALSRKVVKMISSNLPRPEDEVGLVPHLFAHEPHGGGDQLGRRVAKVVPERSQGRERRGAAAKATLRWVAAGPAN